MTTGTRTEQVFLYVYREGALFIVLSKTDPSHYDIPSWFFRGDVGSEDAERLLADYFAEVVVTDIAKLDSSSYACRIRKDAKLKEGSVYFFGTSHSVCDGYRLTERAKKALFSL